MRNKSNFKTKEFIIVFFFRRPYLRGSNEQNQEMVVRMLTIMTGYSTLTILRYLVGSKKILLKAIKRYGMNY